MGGLESSYGIDTALKALRGGTQTLAVFLAVRRVNRVHALTLESFAHEQKGPHCWCRTATTRFPLISNSGEHHDAAAACRTHLGLRLVRGLAAARTPSSTCCLNQSRYHCCFCAPRFALEPRIDVSFA